MTVAAQLAPFVIIANYVLFRIVRKTPGFVEHLAFAGAALAVIAAALVTGTDYGPVLPVLLVGFLVVAGWCHGRAEGATREHLETTAGIAVAAFDLDIDVLSKPTAVLIPETVDGPFTGRVYRALPDYVAQVEGHPRGLIVFLDDAERILDTAQTDAYADGRADQAAADVEHYEVDPEQADAFPAERPVLSDEARARLASPDAPRVRINPADVLHIDPPVKLSLLDTLMADSEQDEDEGWWIRPHTAAAIAERFITDAVAADRLDPKEPRG